MNRKLGSAGQLQEAERSVSVRTCRATTHDCPPLSSEEHTPSQTASAILAG